MRFKRLTQYPWKARLTLAFSRLSLSAQKIACIAVLALLLIRGLVDPLLCTDPWQYHMTFAALLWDINDAVRVLGLGHARFYGFGLTANWWQGFFWWLTGSVNFLPLVNFIPLVMVVMCGAIWFGLSAPFLTFALVAMPLVAIHATSGYIDLFVGALIVVAAMSCIRLLMLCREQSPRRLLYAPMLLLAFSATMAANAKLHAPFPVAALLLFAMYRLWQQRRDELRPFAWFNWRLSLSGLVLVSVAAWQQHQIPVLYRLLFIGIYLAIHALMMLGALFLRRPSRYSRHRFLLLFLVLVMFGSFATYIKNAYSYNNPVYPLQVLFYNNEVLFNGSESRNYNLSRNKDPFWWRPFLYVLSLTEWDLMLHPPSHYIYTEASQTGANRPIEFEGRTGGLFGPNIWCLALLVAFAVRTTARPGRASPLFSLTLDFLILLFITGMWTMQSHELRYTLAVPIMLVVTAAMAVTHVYRERRWLQHAAPWLALAMLLGIQHYIQLQRYLVPDKFFSYYPEGVKQQLDPKALTSFRKFGKVCLIGLPPPYKYEIFQICTASYFAYTPVFTRENYRTGWIRDPEECRKLEAALEEEMEKDRKALAPSTKP